MQGSARGIFPRFVDKGHDEARPVGSTAFLFYRLLRDATAAPGYPVPRRARPGGNGSRGRGGEPADDEPDGNGAVLGAQQSREPGGEMRFANESTFELTRDFAAGATRVDWVRNFAYPTPRTFKFTEIVTPGAGYVIGVDSNGRNRQSLSMKPPAHAMSGLRLATTQRELARSSPWLLQEMRHNADKVSPAGDIVIGSVTYAAVRYNAGAHAFIIAFDPESGLPARIRTLDYDNVWGDVNYDLVFSDWRMAGGVRIPARQRYELNGRVVIDITITGMTANSQVVAGRFEPPAAVKEGAAAPA